MTRSPLPCVFAAALGLALAAPGSAVEISDLKIDFQLPPAPPDPDASGSLRLRAQGGGASLQIRLRDVDADPVHLCAGSDAANLLHRAELDSSGGTLTSDDGLDFDPRGKVLVVSEATDCSDSSSHLLVATLDEPGTCQPGSRTKIYERAALEPGGVAPPEATAELLYHLLPDRNCRFAGDQQGQPRRKARLSVRVKHAEANTSYDVCIDDDPKGDLDTNAAGVGRADFTFNPPKGNGQGSGKRSVIDFDAYASPVEIRTDDCAGAGDEATAVFHGTLLAPLCEELDLGSGTLAAVAPATGAGQAQLRRTEGCALEFEVSVEDLTPDGTTLASGDHRVAVDGTLRGDPFAVSGGAGEAVFSSDPDAGEELLDFDPNGQVEVRPAPDGAPLLAGPFPTP